MVVVKPTMLPALGLYRYIRFMHENGQDATPYEVAFWGKIAMPAVTLVMVFLSIPFVFGMLRSVGIGQRIFAGTLIGITLLLVNKVFGHLAVVYGLDPFLAATLPGALALGFASLSFRRMH